MAGNPWDFLDPSVVDYYSPRNPQAQGATITPSSSDIAAINGKAPPPGSEGGVNRYKEDILKELDKSNKRINDLRKKEFGEDAYINSLKDALGKTEQKSTQVDLSPLMGLADNWFGGNMQSGYKTPYTEGRKEQEIAALQNAIGKRQGAMTDAEMKSVSDAIKTEGYLQQGYSSQLKNLMKPEVSPGDARREKQVQLGVNKDYNKEFGKGIRGLAGLTKQINGSAEILKRNGGIPDFMSEDRQLLNSKISQIITSYNRDYAQLGALAGQDLPLLQQAVGLSGQALKDYVNEKVYGPESAQKVLEELANHIDQVIRKSENVIDKNYLGMADGVYKADVKYYEDMIGGKVTETPQEGDDGLEAVMKARGLL